MKVLIDHPWADIAAVLTEMDMGLAALVQRRATPDAVKQGMMQNPLTVRTPRVGPHAATP